MRRILLAALAIWLCGECLVLGEQQPPAPTATAPGDAGPAFAAPAFTAPAAPGADAAALDALTLDATPLEGPVDYLPNIIASGPGSGHLWWGTSDYLLWAFKNAPLSTPLVIAGPAGGSSQPVLGQPGEQLVLGGSNVPSGMRSGGRFTLGRWLDAGQTVGIEGGFLFLTNRTVTQGVSSSGAPGSTFLALPFYDPSTRAESSTAIASPGAFGGTATLSNSSQMRGAEFTGVANTSVSGGLRRELLAGFRYFDLTENLAFDTVSPNVAPPSDVFRTHDEFNTRNNFYGGQLGMRGEFDRGLWFIQGTGKLAMGNMHETVGINGSLVTNDFNHFGQPQTFTGGYLAQPSNSGQQSQNRFAVIPEVNLNLGIRLTQRLRVRVGYSFLYASSVARPGDQIDRVINPSQSPAISSLPSTTLVGVARPAAQISSTSFWAQGFNAGLDLSY